MIVIHKCTTVPSNTKNCVLYPRPLTCQKEFFAVLYVPVMRLARCYKTTVFYIYYIITPGNLDPYSLQYVL